MQENIIMYKKVQLYTQDIGIDINYINAFWEQVVYPRTQ